MTTITTEKFVHKTLYANAIRVTEENKKEVAAWCHSPIRVLKNPDGKVTDVFIKIHTPRPITNRQTKAYVGDWILCIDDQFRIYTDHEFTESFERDQTIPPETAKELEENDDIRLVNGLPVQGS